MYKAFLLLEICRLAKLLDYSMGIFLIEKKKYKNQSGVYPHGTLSGSCHKPGIYIKIVPMFIADELN